MITTLSSLWPILVFFVLGYCAKIMGLTPAGLPLKINKVAIRVIFPAVILLSVPQLEIREGVYFAILAPWLCLAIAATTVLLLSRVFKWPREIEGALLVLTALGNTGFLGMPMIDSLFGLEHLAIAVVFDQLGTFIALSTYGIILVAIYSGDQRVSSIQIVKKILFFPPFITLIFALFLSPTSLAPIHQILEIMASALIPITMLSIGMQFVFRVDREDLVPLIAGLSIKMLLLPLVIGVLGYGLSVSAAVFQTSVFQSATPPMVTAAVILTAHNIAPKFTASVLGFGTLLALFWLPMVYFILNA
jgi:hypothetical protein